MAAAEAASDGVVLLLRAATNSLRLMSDGDAGEGLGLPLREARDALAGTNAVYCAVDGSGRLVVRASADSAGLQVDDISDLVTTLSSRVLRSGKATRATATGGHGHGAGQNPAASARVEHGPTMAVPVRSNGEVVGVLSVSRLRGEPDYTDAELSALLTFGDFMGVVTDLERQRAARESVVEMAVRERLSQALFDSVISDLMRATTGIYGVIAAVDDGHREELTRSVRAVDRAIVGFRGILAGRFAEPSPDLGDGGSARVGRNWVESTVGFSGFLAPSGDSYRENDELVDEPDDYVVAILGDLFKVTLQLASMAHTLTPDERQVISESIRQLDALTKRLRGAARRIRASDPDQGRCRRLHAASDQTNS